MNIFELDTPALVVDLDVMEANLQRMADYTQSHHLRLRPHTKTHKSPLLAKRQLELGAVGLTVAKSGEAEVMLAAQPKDLLLAYPTFGAAKMQRLAAVAKQSQLTVALDSLEAAQGLSDAGIAAKILVEFDAGMGRVGVKPDELIPLIQSIQKLPHVEYDGLAFYPGHIKDLSEDGLAKLRTLNDVVGSTVERLTQAGYRPRVVSGGSTPTMYHSHKIEGLNEIRPGTYIFNDRNTINSDACTLEQCAATIVATVVSTSQPGQILIDGGSKTFSSDRLNNDTGVSFGMVLGAPGAHFHKMNEEHGFIDVTQCDRKFHVGEKLQILMNHVCVVMNLHEQAHGHRNGIVETSWPIAARGKLL
ncbi:alanine racemase [Bryobacter aggregatus]|uniref:alanine racemase n=1 Tax=Bryobacter aggregatus TaxID=360054 RepID=UPI0004E0E522|nr:alanine racemase [Bryobacter aggregatus]